MLRALKIDEKKSDCIRNLLHVIIKISYHYEIRNAMFSDIFLKICLVFIQQNNFFIHAIGTLNYLYLGTIIMSKEIISFHQIWILFGIHYAYVKLLCIIHMYLMHNYIVHVEAVLIAKCFPILFRKEGFVEDYFKTMADSSIPYHDQNRGLYCIFLKSLNRKLIYIESQEFV